MVLAQKQKYRSMEQIENPKINPRTYGYLIFDKVGHIQWGKVSLFNKWYWENWTATFKRMKLEHFLILYTKINSKWIKDLNVCAETIKLLEKDIGRILDDINQSKILYEPPLRVMEIKIKANTPTKARLVRATVFSVAMHGCESWTIKKAEHRRIDAFELWC